MHPNLTAMLYQWTFFFVIPLSLPLSLSLFLSLFLSLPLYYLFIKMLVKQYRSNETEDNIQWEKKRKGFMKDGSSVFKFS